MKLYKLNPILIAACCAVTNLCLEIKGAEDFGNLANNFRNIISNFQVITDREMQTVLLQSTIDQALVPFREENLIVREKLESLSQEFISYRSSTSMQLQEEREVNANLKEQLRNMAQERQQVVDQFREQLEAVEQERQERQQQALLLFQQQQEQRISQALGQVIRENSQLREQLESAQNQIRQIEMRLYIPLVAQGHEAIYQRFLNGVLLFKPNKGSDNGMIKLPIAALTNPLEGTFDLSRCGDAEKYLSISTGYRKRKKTENANKIEIWLTPRFLVEKEIKTTAEHFSAIFQSKWPDSASIGIFWVGGWCDNMDWCDYLTSENIENLSKTNLFGNWWKATHPPQPNSFRNGNGGAANSFSPQRLEELFHVCL